jgi:hypothetical protein
MTFPIYEKKMFQTTNQIWWNMGAVKDKPETINPKVSRLGGSSPYKCLYNYNCKGKKTTYEG